MINRDGKLICPPKYTRIGGQPEVPGLIPVTLNRLKGFIDSSGNEIVPPVYGEIMAVENNTFFIVKKGSFYGLLDTAGNEKIPVFYQKIYRFWSQKQCFIVKKEGKFGIVNADNRTLTPVIYDSLTTDFIIFKNNKAGLLDIHFKEMIPCQYDRIDHIYSNKYFLYQSWKKGVADNRTGDHIPPGDWEDIEVSPDRETGYFRIKMGQKWGYVDRFGKIRVPVRFDAISNFKNGVAHVLIEPHQPAFTSTYNYVKWGPYAYTLPYPLDYVINTAGELLPMENENPRPFYYAQ